MENRLEILMLADQLKAIQKLIMQLDLTLLEESLKGIKDQNSFRESASILDPSPFTSGARIDLERLKERQLRLYVDLCKNLHEIGNAELQVMQAQANTSQMAKLFGL